MKPITLYILSIPMLTFSNGCSWWHPPTQYAFIDRSGSIRIRLTPGQYARSFSEGLAAVERNGRWGYMDKEGRMVVEPRFGGARDFHEGLAAATMVDNDNSFFEDTPVGFINKTGSFVISAKFGHVGDFSEGLAPACERDCVGADAKGLTGYIDRHGQYVIAPQFIEAAEFSEGLASAARERSYENRGYVDRQGKFVIAPRFTLAYPFAGGVAPVGDGAIDRAGKIVFANRYSRPGGVLSSGRRLILLEDDNPTFVDLAGKPVLKVGYQSVGEFAEGLAPACPSDCGNADYHKWGFMDETGNMVIKPQFGFGSRPFSEGLAFVALASP